MSESMEKCPFCEITFKFLGKHLPRCEKREGREYAHFLKKKIPKVRNPL